MAISQDTLAASSVFTDYATHVWTELVLRSLASETNLLLPSSRLLVVGGGPVADGLAGALTRLGGRVELASSDPVELVAISHRFAVVARYIATTQFISADVDVVIATGRSHPPLTPDTIATSHRPLVVVNAALPPDVDSAAFRASDTVGTTRNLTQFSSVRPIFVVPAVQPTQLDRATADVRSAFAPLLAAVGPDDVDTELAKVLLT